MKDQRLDHLAEIFLTHSLSLEKGTAFCLVTCRDLTHETRAMMPLHVDLC